MDQTATAKNAVAAQLPLNAALAANVTPADVVSEIKNATAVTADAATLRSAKTS